MFHSRALRDQERECLCFKKEGVYRSLSWGEVDERVLNLAGYLVHLGLRKGERVAILSWNCPEWAIADLAILAIGCVTVPIYPTLTLKEIDHLLSDSEAKCLLASPSSNIQAVPNWDGLVLSFEESAFSKILLEGENFRRDGEETFSLRLRQTTETDLASIIYTSGTTGEPKGVMLSHDNFLSNCRSCQEAIPISEKDTYLSFLPLSHVFERMAGFYFILFREGRIAYAENMETVFKNMQEIQPTVISGVPRFFEKIHEGILTSVSQKGALQQKLFFWALKIGAAKARAFHAETPLLWGIRLQYPLAAFLVLSPLRRKLGRSLRFFISGGAPLSATLIEFFASFDCIILEGYGLTETSPVISVNRLERRKWGSVGFPVPGVEVKISEDGEVLARGPNVMQGYYRCEEETKKVFRDGYFCTGDIGYLDAEGFLFITDRKKDLIKTSGGKFVSPQKIEELLKNDPLIDEAVVFGDNRKYIVSLLAPNFKRLEHYAAQKGISFENRAALLSQPEILSLFHKRIEERLKDVASFEKVKKFALLERELTQQEGELTPTLKVKRKLLYQKYTDLIESLYRE